MKLHLGSGSKRIPGFKNVDIRMDVRPDVVADVRYLSDFDSDSVEEIYFCHGIEHLSYHDANLALQEWRRVLRPGSTLRLSVPDFDRIMELYKIRGLDDQVLAIICGGQEYRGNTHYSVWNAKRLTDTLMANGYSDIRRYDARSFLPRGCSDYSILTVNGVFISLNVEAIA